MKQLGNLAVVCAGKRNVLMQVLDGKATVHLGHGPHKKTMTADWDDDAAINEMVRIINFGHQEKEKR